MHVRETKWKQEIGLLLLLTHEQKKIKIKNNLTSKIRFE